MYLTKLLEKRSNEIAEVFFVYPQSRFFQFIRDYVASGIVEDDKVSIAINHYKSKKPFDLDVDEISILITEGVKNEIFAQLVFRYEKMEDIKFADLCRNLSPDVQQTFAERWLSYKRWNERGFILSNSEFEDTIDWIHTETFNMLLENFFSLPVTSIFDAVEEEIFQLTAADSAATELDKTRGFALLDIAVRVCLDKEFSKVYHYVASADPGINVTQKVLEVDNSLTCLNHVLLAFMHAENQAIMETVARMTDFNGKPEDSDNFIIEIVMDEYQPPHLEWFFEMEGSTGRPDPNITLEIGVPPLASVPEKESTSDMLKILYKNGAKPDKQILWGLSVWAYVFTHRTFEIVKAWKEAEIPMNFTEIVRELHPNLTLFEHIVYKQAIDLPQKIRFLAENVEDPTTLLKEKRFHPVKILIEKNMPKSLVEAWKMLKNTNLGFDPMQVVRDTYGNQADIRKFEDILLK